MTLIFQDLEDGYIEKVKDAYKLGFGSVASVGCCALIAIHKDSDLVCANAGDCRAVLGKQIGGGWGAWTLTNDHNCR